MQAGRLKPVAGTTSTHRLSLCLRLQKGGTAEANVSSESGAVMLDLSLG